MSTTIEQTINSVAYGDLKEGFIPCESKGNQESTRVMAYAVKSKMNKVYKELLGITKVEEDGVLFVKIYKKPLIETWIRDEVTGKLKPMNSKPVDTELQIAADYMKKAGVNEDKIMLYLESGGEILPEIGVKKAEVEATPEEESDESWKERELDVRKSEKELMLEMMKGERK